MTQLRLEQQLRAQTLESLATEAALTSAQQQAELQVIIEEVSVLHRSLGASGSEFFLSS